jgi:hypothetical protein
MLETAHFDLRSLSGKPERPHDEPALHAVDEWLFKKIENHAASVALGYFAYTSSRSTGPCARACNGCWRHESAVEVSDLVALWEAEERRLERAA